MLSWGVRKYLAEARDAWGFFLVEIARRHLIAKVLEAVNASACYMLA